jgi:hypothetical protein
MIIDHESDDNGYNVDLNEGDCAIVFPKDGSTPFLVYADEIKNDSVVPINVIMATEVLLNLSDKKFYKNIVGKAFRSIN